MTYTPNDARVQYSGRDLVNSTTAEDAVAHNTSPDIETGPQVPG